MQHAFLYISLPSLHDYDVKIPNCKFYVGRKRATTNFFNFPSLKLSALLKKSTRGKFAYICHFHQIGINATVFEKREFILKVTFSLPLPSSMLKLPNTYSSWPKPNEKRMAVKKERVLMIERSFDPS